MIRHGAVELSPDEAAQYTEDERANLRSWGLGVPEPEPCPPDVDYVLPNIDYASEIIYIRQPQLIEPAFSATAFQAASGSYGQWAGGTIYPVQNPRRTNWRIK